MPMKSFLALDLKTQPAQIEYLVSVPVPMSFSAKCNHNQAASFTDHEYSTDRLSKVVPHIVLSSS